MISIDIAIESAGWPPEEELRELAGRAVAATVAELNLKPPAGCELSLLFADDARMRALNSGWRGKDKPTNVLSFPAFPMQPGGAVPPMLGDIALGRETLEREAVEQAKTFNAHLTHLLVHGLLHLLGHDHETDAEAQTMEDAERRVLARLAISDPYA